jgi:MFS family permease
VTRVVTRVEGPPEVVEPWLVPRDDLVGERPAPTADGTLLFVAAHGPVEHYQRRVTTEDLTGGRQAVTSTTDIRLAIPYFGWLFTLPVRHALGRIGRPGHQPWWAPPERLDARAASVLGVLGLASVVAGYLGTLLTQTITFAAAEFGLVGAQPQGNALAAVRLGILVALALVALADRRGRRPVLLGCTIGGCAMSMVGALAPSLAALSASQLLARAFATALVVVITIVAAEEVPRGSRAYAVSVLGMASGLGAGLCVVALPLADLGTRGWRLLYLLPLAGLPVARAVAGRLDESRRFRAPHAVVTMAGHGRRLLLLAASAFLLAVFTAPASQLQNEFLRDERGYSASGIALFTVLTVSPASIGIVAGGRLADLRGRRMVGAIGLAGGVGATVAMFNSTGWLLWAWSVLGSVVGGAVLPALGVYGPELFPTSLRGRANGLVALLGVVGSVLGLLGAGALADHLGGLGPALAVLALGPVLLVALVALAYPETAQRELEELNPEDLPPAPGGSTPPPRPPPRRRHP